MALGKLSYARCAQGCALEHANVSCRWKQIFNYTRSYQLLLLLLLLLLLQLLLPLLLLLLLLLLLPPLLLLLLPLGGGSIVPVSETLVKTRLHQVQAFRCSILQ